jgi:hypothetical protein
MVYTIAELLVFRRREFVIFYVNTAVNLYGVSRIGLHFRFHQKSQLLFGSIGLGAVLLSLKLLCIKIYSDC